MSDAQPQGLQVFLRLLARYAQSQRHLPSLYRRETWRAEVSKKHDPKERCYACRRPIPLRLGTKKKEGPWELIEGSGHWFCMACILRRINDAEVKEANRALDAWVERNSKRDQP